jgi:hypothetical protein
VVRRAIPGSAWSAGVLQGALLLAVLSLAATLRTVDLTAIGFNSDEAVYASQGAAIADDPVLRELFPVFRAHPLLYQFTLALAFRVAAVDEGLARLVSAAFGLVTVLVVYLVGKRMYGPWTGLAAALFLAVMPYHVVVTRQVLLDGAMTLFATVSLAALACFATTHRPAWLHAAAAAMGLTFLAKETGILMVGAVYAFLALAPEIRLRISDVLLSVATMAGTMAAFPLSVTLAGGGGSGTTRDYLVWQLLRRPNHDWDFYLRAVPPAIGFPVLAAAGLGLALLWRDTTWRERLLVLWVIVPVAFFQAWPTKGFQYLMPAAPPLALLAARTLTKWPPSRSAGARWRTIRLGVATVAILTIASSLLAVSWPRVQPAQGGTFLAGSGGVPGGREAAYWIGANVPAGATIVTIGPSMANILQFYGHRRALGLSVSPNPLHRNPAYEPVRNLDFEIRTSGVQYLVWDSFSAARSRHFSERLLSYVRKYDGRPIHTETVPARTPAGTVIAIPAVVIYEVRP